jgi:signal transduction histidine kinase
MPERVEERTSATREVADSVVALLPSTIRRSLLDRLPLPAATQRLRRRIPATGFGMTAAAAAFLVAWTLLLAAVPFLRFAVHAPRVRLPLETASVIAATLTAAVAYIRFSVNDDTTWMYVSVAFLVVALNQFTFGVVIPPGEAAPQPSTYVWILARLVAGVVLLIGAFAVPRRRRRDRAPSLRYVTVAAIVVGILVGMQVIVWFQSSSLPRVAGAPAAVSSLSSVTVADVFLQSLGAAIFTAAALGFRRTTPEAASKRTWLVAALLLAALSHLHYMLVPTIYTNRVSMGDLLRLAMSAVLLVGLVADVRRDALRERQRADDLDARYRLARARVADLERADRAKADVARMLAHELMHPVATVRTLAAALRTSWDTLPEAQRRAALDGLVDQSRQLGALAASAPEIAELRMDIYSLEREPQSVREVLAAVDRAYSHLGARLVLADDDGMEARLVCVDLARILQVFHNLVSNATKFAPRGTSIEIGVRAADAAAVFTVRDHGPGIPDAEAERVFDRFTRTRGSVEAGIDGQGLGLYISRLIVDAHGGRIWVEPTDEGATFAFSVPLVEAGP